MLIRKIYSVLIIIATSSVAYGYKLQDDTVSKKLHVNVYYKDANKNDTLTLGIGQAPFIIDELYQNTEIKSVKNDLGFYSFLATVNTDYGYFTLKKPRTFTKLDDGNMMDLINSQFWEANDSITIVLDHTETITGIHYTCRFAGRGSLKYTVRDTLRNLKIKDYGETLKNRYGLAINSNIKEYQYTNALSPLDSAKLNLLQSYKDRISDLSYKILKADIIYSGIPIASIAGFYTKNFKDKTPDNRFLSLYRNAFDYSFLYALDERALSNSLAYYGFLYRKYYNESIMVNKSFSPDYMYNRMNNDLVGKVRDKAVTFQFLRAKRSTEIDKLFKAELTLVQDPYCKLLLKELSNIIKVPNFTFSDLEDSEGNKVSLSDFKDKVVVIDFWFTGCGGCLHYYNDILSVVEDRFKSQEDVVFVTISVDQNKDIWLRSLNSGKYTSVTSINLFTSGLGMNHPDITKNKLILYPTAILLDKEHRIAFFNTVNLFQIESLEEAIKNLL